MARWIDANPQMRMYQYVLPAARQTVAEAPKYAAACRAEIARLWAERSTHDLATYERRRGTRRVRSAIRELRLYERDVQRARDLIAEHG